jgi:hypothetical protein
LSFEHPAPASYDACFAHGAASCSCELDEFSFHASPAIAIQQHEQHSSAKKVAFKNFEDMIEKIETPLLVDFYAVWW